MKGKLLDSLNAIEHTGSLENGVVESEQHAQQPLSLHAIADGPKLWLLWASFQQLEKEAGTVFVVFFFGYFFSYFFLQRIFINQLIVISIWSI